MDISRLIESIDSVTSSGNLEAVDKEAWVSCPQVIHIDSSIDRKIEKVGLAAADPQLSRFTIITDIL
jgi:hypothetical protein